MVRALWSAAAVSLGTFMCGCAGIFLRQANLVFHPHGDIAGTPGEAGLKYDDLTLEPAPGAKINAWFIPADNPRATVIFSHGNAENIGDLLDYVEFYQDLRANLLLYDYRGYGRSTGKPSENATYEDIASCWKYLTETRGTPPSQIVLVGRSLGGAVAAHLAAGVRPRGLVLESSFTSVPDVGKGIFPFLPVRLIARIFYDTAKLLPKINCPILILHSPQDEVIPYSHGVKLFEAAKEPKKFVQIRAGHNDGPYEKGESYRRAIDEFLSGGTVRNSPAR